MSRPSVTGNCADGILTVEILVDQIREPDQSYAVRDEVLRLLGSTGATHVVLDFANVRSMGSVGMLALLGIRRELANGRIVLVQLSDLLRQMLKVCRLIGDTPGSSPFDTDATAAAAQARLRADA